MVWTARLKSLDERVLGKPKTPNIKDSRRGTLIGVLGVLVMILVAVVTQASSFVYAAVSLFFLTAMNAVQWRRLKLAERDRE